MICVKWSNYFENRIFFPSQRIHHYSISKRQKSTIFIYKSIKLWDCIVLDKREVPTNFQQPKNGTSGNIENAMWYYSQRNILTAVLSATKSEITDIILVKTLNLLSHERLLPRMNSIKKKFTLHIAKQLWDQRSYILFFMSFFLL